MADYFLWGCLSEFILRVKNVLVSPCFNNECGFTHLANRIVWLCVSTKLSYEYPVYHWHVTWNTYLLFPFFILYISFIFIWTLKIWKIWFINLFIHLWKMLTSTTLCAQIRDHVTGWHGEVKIMLAYMQHPSSQSGGRVEWKVSFTLLNAELKVSADICFL